MEISGLPIHILLLHFAVVLAPLAALAAIAYVLVPRWRTRLVVPMSVLTLVATGATLLTGHFGEELEKAMPAEDAIRTHALYGGIAEKVAAALLFAVVLAVCAFDARPSARFTWLRPSDSRLMRVLATVAVVLFGVATIVLIILAGHSGAYAAWHDWRG